MEGISGIADIPGGNYVHWMVNDSHTFSDPGIEASSARKASGKRMIQKKQTMNSQLLQNYTPDFMRWMHSTRMPSIILSVSNSLYSFVVAASCVVLHVSWKTFAHALLLCDLACINGSSVHLLNLERSSFLARSLSFFQHFLIVLVLICPQTEPERTCMAFPTRQEWQFFCEIGCHMSETQKQVQWVGRGQAVIASRGQVCLCEQWIAVHTAEFNRMAEKRVLITVHVARMQTTRNTLQPYSTSLCFGMSTERAESQHPTSGAECRTSITSPAKSVVESIC